MATTILNDNLQNNSPKALDNKHGKLVTVVWEPYADVAEANASINIAYRHKGLTVIILVGGHTVEYWYRDGISDINLVRKAADRFAVAGEDDTANEVRSFNMNSQTFSFTSGFNMLFMDPVARLWQIGDSTGVYNNSYLEIDDVNETAKFAFADYTSAQVGNVLALTDPATGDVAWTDPLASMDANNGLHIPSTGLVYLGGTLVENTQISTALLHLTIQGTIPGATTGVLIVNNTAVVAGNAIYATSNNSGSSAIVGNSTSGGGVIGVSGSNTGVTGQSTSSNGIYGSSVSNTGITGISNTGLAGSFTILPASNNTTASVANLIRATSTTAANGIAGSLDFLLQDSGGTSFLSNQLISKWIDVIHSTRTSEFSIAGVNSGVTGIKFIIKGSGVINLPVPPTNFADNAAAISGGLLVGDLYRNGDILQIVH